MKLSLAQLTFIALLTLLQIVAPLVHAHTGYDGFSESGIHLPGLEQYTPCETHESVTSAEHRHSHSDIVVSVGSGVEKKRSRGTSTSETAIFINLCIALIATQSPPHRIDFPVVSPILSPPLNTATPVRAPPAFRLS